MIELLGCSRSFLKKELTKKVRSVKVLARSSFSIDLNILNNGKVNPSYKALPLTILSEDERFIAFYKPPFVHSHPHSYSESDNCLSFFRSKNIFSILNVNLKNYDRGLVYRIDFLTSGLLIACKNDNFYEEIRKNFSSMVGNKIYYALVEGEFLAKKVTGNIDTTRKKVLVVKGEQDTIEVLETRYFREKNISLLKIKLHQGKRHQIRALLCSIDFPIIGDPLYDGKDASRLYLHAYEYEIQGKTWSCPLGLEDFENYSNSLIF